MVKWTELTKKPNSQHPPPPFFFSRENINYIIRICSYHSSKLQARGRKCHLTHNSSKKEGGKRQHMLWFILSEYLCFIFSVSDKLFKLLTRHKTIIVDTNGKECHGYKEMLLKIHLYPSKWRAGHWTTMRVFTTSDKKSPSACSQMMTSSLLLLRKRHKLFLHSTRLLR